MLQAMRAVALILGLCAAGYGQILAPILTSNGTAGSTSIVIRQVGTGSTIGGATNGCGYQTGTASCALTFSTTTTSDAIFVWILTNGTPATPTMTGETFATYTGATGCQNNTGDVGYCYMATSIIGGQTTLTCAATTSTVSLLCIAFEFSRPSQMSTPNDAGGNTEQASATSLTVSTSASNTVASDIVIGCFGSLGAGATDTYTVGSGFTSIANVSQGAGNTGQSLCEYQLPGTTTTQTATASFGVAARSTNIVVAVKP